MKKAKILFPTLAALVVSSAAAVTGTVAWFTATLSGKAVSDNITVVKASSLGFTINPDENYGTTVDGENVTHGNLTHGSVDLLNGTIFQPDYDTDESTFINNCFKTWENTGTAEKYCATKFTITFNKDFSNDAEGKYGVFIDTSKLDAAAVSHDGGVPIEKALRVGIKCESKVYVYAPYDTESNEFKYINQDFVNGLTAPDVDYGTAPVYKGSTVIKKGGTTPTTYTDLEGASNLLCTLASGAETKEATVYTWLEGIQVDNEQDIVAGYGYTLSFVAVKYTGA